MGKTKLKVYSDWDSTLLNLLPAWIDHCNKEYGKEYCLSHITSWDSMLELYDKPFRFFKDEYFNCKLIDGAKDFINTLQSKYEVGIITHSLREDTQRKTDFIREFFPDIEVIHSGDKYKYVQENILIDDKFENVYQVVKHGGIGILFTNEGKYKYADFIFRDKNFYKVGTYDEALDIIEKVNKEK